MNHTPGPWRVQVTGGEVECVSGARPGLWAVVQGPDYDTRAANARLIAAAPEMLEALNQIVEAGTTYPPGWETFTAEQRLQFPPGRSQEAKIALAALTQVRGK